MTLNTVTLQWDLSDLTQSGLSATLTITPTAQMSDTADHVLIPAVARSVRFPYGTGQLAGIVANDNGSIQPAGTGYLITVVADNGQVLVPQFQTQVNFANGATQWLDQLAVVPVVTTSYQYLPLPSGTPQAGQVPVATGTGEGSGWDDVSAGVTSVNGHTGAVTLGPADIGADASGAAASALTAAEAHTAALVPLAAKGDLLYENATPASARLPIGSAGQMLGVSGGVPAWSPAMTLLATTGTAGYALVNGTGTILSWTAPNDGQIHRVMVLLTSHVTSTETGGQINLAITAPDGVTGSPQIQAASQGAGVRSVISGAIVEAGSTVTVTQATALTGGAAVLWAEIWGS